MFWGITFLLLTALGVMGAEVGDRNMVWAHNTPWFFPQDNPGYPQYYYNFPLQESKDTPNGLMDSFREEIRIAQEKGLDGFFLDYVGDTHGGAPHWRCGLTVYR